MNKKGFTLIELLVVVAIIAVLVALLLPALASARNQAKQVTCAVNLKSFFLGFQNYTADNNGFLPLPWNYNDGDPNTNNFNGKLWPYIYPDKSWKGGSSDFTNFMVGVYRCPSNPIPPMPQGFISYAMNYHFSSNGYLSPIKLDSVDNPVYKVMLADGGCQTPEMAGNAVFNWPGWAIYIPQCVAFYRHAEKANCLFAEGHIAPLKVKDFVWPNTYDPSF